MSLKQKISLRDYPLIFATGIFFVIFYLYVWLIIEPSLLYHWLGTALFYPTFSTDWLTIKDTFAVPGGLIDYLVKYLSVWYYYSGLGAAIITVTAFLIFLGAWLVLRPLRNSLRFFISLLNGVAVLMMYNQYDYTLGLCLAFLVSLFFSALYLRIAVTGNLLRASVFAVMFILLYYIAVGASLFFAAIAVVDEIFRRRRFFGGVCFILLGGAIAFIMGIIIFDLPAAEAYLRLIPSGQKMTILTRTVAQCMYAIILLSILVRSLYILAAGQQKQTEDVDSKCLGRKMLVGIFQTVLAVIIFSACLYYSFDPVKKKNIELDYLAQQQLWHEVLHKAGEIPPASFNIFTNHNVNKALYHTGKLGDRMFEFPQLMPALLLVHVKGRTSSQIYLKRMELFLRLGHVNTAEHLAYEILELSGDSPLILRTLVTINLLKGQKDTAKVFLRKMARDPISAKEANRILKQVEDGVFASDSAEIQHLRSIAIIEDKVDFGFELDDFFNRLLSRNQNNRMAFEYMMASYLLTGQVSKVADNISLLADFGYKKLPRYFEEALVIHMGPEGKNIDFDRRWLPGPEAVKRAKEFDRIESKYGSANKQAAMSALKEDFGNSYYYYFVFNLQK
jgi:hypothetical protein